MLSTPYQKPQSKSTFSQSCGDLSKKEIEMSSTTIMAPPQSAKPCEPASPELIAFLKTTTDRGQIKSEKKRTLYQKPQTYLPDFVECFSNSFLHCC